MAKEFYGLNDDPRILGYPTADSASTVRYAANVALGPAIVTSGLGFTVQKVFNFSWAENAGIQKQGIWLPPDDFVITHAVLKMISMTTDAAGDPSTVTVDVKIGSNTYATSGSIGQLCGLSVPNSDLGAPGWSAGAWIRGMVAINATTFTSPVTANLAGNETHGWVFGTLPIVHSAINHDRFYVEILGSGSGTPTQTLTALGVVSLMGYIL